MKSVLTTNLGSTTLSTDSDGVLISELRYKPWGESRLPSGAMPTDYQFTGQRNIADIGLYFYNARFYDASLGRFTSVDTIVPGGVQGLDRYAYTFNNPMNFVDPSGHDPWWCEGNDSCMFNWMEDHTSQGGDGYFAEYEVSVDEGMDRRERSAIMAGIFALGDAFAEARGQGESASDAFTAVLNPFSFLKEDREGCKFNPDTGNVGCGDFTYDHFQSDVNNVLHELGHVFSNVVGGDPEFYFENYASLRNEILRPYDINEGIYWQQHPPPNPFGEMFGDMLIAWVFNAWNESSNPLIVDQVDKARGDMNGQMYTWLNR